MISFSFVIDNPLINSPPGCSLSGARRRAFPDRRSLWSVRFPLGKGQASTPDALERLWIFLVQRGGADAPLLGAAYAGRRHKVSIVN
jgi:hypothetical protein